MHLELSATSSARMPLARSLLAVMFVALAGPVCAQDPPAGSSAEAAIEALNEALKNEPGLSDATKQALSQVVGILKAERAESVTSSKLDTMIDDYTKATSAFSKRKPFENVFNHIKFYGDVRFRLEGEFDRDSQPDRFRPRVRFRLNTDWALADELTLNTRLVTGQRDDANSPHQSFGTTFDKWEANWDRLNLVYKPKCVDGLTVWLGKFNGPHYANPVYGELLWDQDVGAEGVAARYTVRGSPCSSLEKVDFTLGVYDFIESNTLDDTFALVPQISATFKANECLSITGALGYWLWGGPVNGANAVLTGDNAGNATVDLNGDTIPDQFESDFGIINPIVSATYSRWEDWPITVAIEYFKNCEAHNSRDAGFAIGASVGRLAKRGDWKFYYQYQDIEQDAVFSPVAQDDFSLTTNFRGHVFGTWYGINEDMNLHLWALVAARDELGTSPTTDSDQDQWKVRLDFNVRF